MYRLLVAMVLLVIQVESVFSQHNHDKYWVTAGAGFTFSEDFLATGIGLGLTYKRDIFIFSGRYVYAKQFSLGPKKHLQDISLLGGVSQEGDNTIFSVAVGPGLVSGAFSQFLAPDRLFTVLGISLEGQGVLKLGRSLAIGVYTYANFNNEATYVGIWLSFRVGYFRKW